jgi:protein-arginine kinase activator protein McsA
MICDRCGEEKARIVRMVIIPRADKAYFYCDSCFESTPIIRRTHPEWRYFDLAGVVDLQDLAQRLAAKGLLEPKV